MAPTTLCTGNIVRSTPPPQVAELGGVMTGKGRKVAAQQDLDDPEETQLEAPAPVAQAPAPVGREFSLDAAAVDAPGLVAAARAFMVAGGAGGGAGPSGSGVGSSGGSGSGRGQKRAASMEERSFYCYPCWSYVNPNPTPDVHYCNLCGRMVEPEDF